MKWPAAVRRTSAGSCETANGTTISASMAPRRTIISRFSQRDSAGLLERKRSITPMSMTSSQGGGSVVPLDGLAFGRNPLCSVPHAEPNRSAATSTITTSNLSDFYRSVGEAEKATGEEYGESRFLQVLDSSLGSSAPEDLNGLMASVDSFLGCCPAALLASPRRNSEVSGLIATCSRSRAISRDKP
jgi:hypothetical protein